MKIVTVTIFATLLSGANAWHQNFIGWRAGGVPCIVASGDGTEWLARLGVPCPPDWEDQLAGSLVGKRRVYPPRATRPSNEVAAEHASSALPTRPTPSPPTAWYDRLIAWTPDELPWEAVAHGAAKWVSWLGELRLPSWGGQSGESATGLRLSRRNETAKATPMPTVDSPTEPSSIAPTAWPTVATQYWPLPRGYPHFCEPATVTAPCPATATQPAYPTVAAQLAELEVDGATAVTFEGLGPFADLTWAVVAAVALTFTFVNAMFYGLAAKSAKGKGSTPSKYVHVNQGKLEELLSVLLTGPSDDRRRRVLVAAAGDTLLACTIAKLSSDDSVDGPAPSTDTQLTATTENVQLNAPTNNPEPPAPTSNVEFPAPETRPTTQPTIAQFAAPQPATPAAKLATPAAQPAAVQVALPADVQPVASMESVLVPMLEMEPALAPVPNPGSATDGGTIEDADESSSDSGSEDNGPSDSSDDDSDDDDGLTPSADAQPATQPDAAQDEAPAPRAEDNALTTGAKDDAPTTGARDDAPIVGAEVVAPGASQPADAQLDGLSANAEVDAPSANAEVDAPAAGAKVAELATDTQPEVPADIRPAAWPTITCVVAPSIEPLSDDSRANNTDDAEPTAAASRGICHSPSFSDSTQRTADGLEPDSKPETPINGPGVADRKPNSAIRDMVYVGYYDNEGDGKNGSAVKPVYKSPLAANSLVSLANERRRLRSMPRRPPVDLQVLAPAKNISSWQPARTSQNSAEPRAVWYGGFSAPEPRQPSTRGNGSANVSELGGPANANGAVSPMGGRRDLRELPGGQLSDSPVGGAPLSNITNLPSVSFSFDFGDTRNVRFGGSSATEPSQRSSHGSDSGDLNKVSKPANSASTAGSQLLDNASPSPLPVNSSSSSSGGTVVSLIPTVQPGEPAAPTGSLATQSTAPPAFNTEAKAVESSDEPDSDAEGSGQRKTARRKKHRKHKRSKRNQARRRRKEAAALAAAEHISEPDNAPDAASPQNPVASIPEPATTGAVPETPSVLGLDTIAVGNSGSVVEVPNNNDFESLLEFVHNLTDEGLEQVRANMMATGIPIDDELFGVPTETTAPAALAETAETEESGDQPSASGAVQHPTTTSSVQPNW